MEMLNLDHLVSIKNCAVNDIEIKSFNLIEGDWVYIAGNIETAQLIYKLITLQSVVTSGELKIFAHKIDQLSNEQTMNIRQYISTLPIDLTTEESDQSIVNNLCLIKSLKKSESSKILNQLKSEIIYNEDIIDSNEVKNILKALSIKPKVVFVNFSFDKFENSKITELLDPLYKYMSKTGLAIIFCTNNSFIQSRYKSRIYKAELNSITE